MLITYNKDDQAKKIYTYGNTTDQPISMEYRSDQEGEGQGQWRTAYYLYDGQGNVRQLVNSRGQVIATYNYLPFGEMMNRGMRGQGTKENGGMGITLGRLQNWGRKNELRNTITYQGREYDRDSGFYYFRARYQDPRLGRFLEVDPLLREVPEYTTGNSWPTGTSSGCSSCGGSGIPSSISSSVFNPAELQIYIIQMQQIFPLLLNNANSVSNLYMFEKNAPINNLDPTGNITIPNWLITFAEAIPGVGTILNALTPPPGSNTQDYSGCAVSNTCQNGHYTGNYGTKEGAISQCQKCIDLKIAGYKTAYGTSFGFHDSADILATALTGIITPLGFGAIVDALADTLIFTREFSKIQQAGNTAEGIYCK